MDYKVDKKKLKEIFNLAGKVVDIDMYLDKDGNSRGNAVVEFSHPVESVQAISMFHNQELYDRKMRIYMDRFNDPHRLPEGLKSLGPGLGDAGAPLRDIAFNLPNQNSAGNVSLGISNPLNSLNASVLLQAANLGNVGNLQTNVLGKTLGGTGDIPSLVSYPIIQNQSTSNFGLSKFGSSQNFGSNVSATRGQGFESRFPSQSGSAFPRKSMIGKSNKVLLSNVSFTILDEVTFVINLSFYSFLLQLPIKHSMKSVHKLVKYYVLKIRATVALFCHLIMNGKQNVLLVSFDIKVFCNFINQHSVI